LTALDQFCRSTHTLKNHDVDFHSWHRGQPYYYFWSINIDCEEWTEAFFEAGKWLEGFLVKGYQRRPHVTILPAGFSMQITLQVAQLEKIAAAIPPFELTLGTLGSFTACACFEVHCDSDALQDVRHRLHGVMADSDVEISVGMWRPHLTVGLYRDQYLTSNVAEKIHAFSQSSRPTIPVRAFQLARYDTKSIKGPIETVAEFTLDGNGHRVLLETELLR